MSLEEILDKAKKASKEEADKLKAQQDEAERVVQFLEGQLKTYSSQPRSVDDLKSAWLELDPGVKGTPPRM